jgi:hypothetical protein
MPMANSDGDVTNGPAHERVTAEELARLRRIEEVAREVLRQMQGRRSASPMLAAIAALRAALKEEVRRRATARRASRCRPRT